MKLRLPLFCLLFFSAFSAQAQFSSDGRSFNGSRPELQPPNRGTRSAQKPVSCSSDTSYFTSYGSSAFNSVTIRSGSSLGQYFGANQTLTVSGFRIYAYSLVPNPARPVYIKLRCNLYKAGLDSLPTGSPLASDTITVDTVMGSSISLSRIERDAVFDKPVTLNYGYILVVECDSTNVSAALVTNSWAAGNGRKRNLGCGSVSGKWYRCLQLNIGGVTFDADMQMYPFVKYNFGTDFSIVNDCYNFGDTVKFSNKHKSNLSSMPYYNYYSYINALQFSHRWNYDNGFTVTYAIDGAFKPATKKNFNVQLISTIIPYTANVCNDTANVTVFFKPDKPTLKKQARGCIGDTVKIDLAADAGVTLNWYHTVSDPSPFNTGASLTLNNVQTNDTFYVQAVNGDCKSPMLRIDFAVSDYPKYPVTVNDSICQGAAANLSASSDLGKIEWYTVAAGGGMIFVGNTVQTGPLFADTQFYVQANNNGCINKGGRAVVKAFVGSAFAPAKPTVVMDTFMCLRPTSSIDIKAKQSGSDTLRWFSNPTGGKPIHIGDSFTFTPTGRGDEVYYVETWNGICGSGRSPVNIHVYDYPAVYGLRGDTICPGQSAEPFLSVPWGTANWYLSKLSPAPIYVGETPSFQGLGTNTTYYIRTEENGCSGGFRDSVTILVNNPPIPSLVKADAVCAKGIGSMSVTVPVGKVNWYYQPTDPTPFHTGSTVSAGLILSNVTYFYETENKGCLGPKVPLTVVMKPRPTAGFTWVLQWQNRLICTPITTSGLTLSWDWGDGKTSTGLPAVHQYDAKGQYTVRLVTTSTSNGCKDTADIPVLIDHAGIQDQKADVLTAYPIPVSQGEVLHIQGLSADVAHATIVGINGQKIAELQVRDGILHLPEHVGAGLYFVRLVQGGNAANIKILVTE